MITALIMQELEVQTNLFVYQCSSQPLIRLFMQAMILCSMGIFQISALYLAFRTRKVKVKGLNDAKYTAMTVYITTITLLLTLVITFTLSNYITAYATIYSVGLWIGSTVLLAIMFVPKV